jgi:hypothetical protein
MFLFFPLLQAIITEPVKFEIKPIIPIVQEVKQKTTEELIRQYFGEAGDEAVAVARAESGLNPSAINYQSDCVGLFQIKLFPNRPSKEELLTLEGNIKTAYTLYQQQGWCIWEVSRKLGLCE